MSTVPLNEDGLGVVGPVGGETGMDGGDVGAGGEAGLPSLGLLGGGGSGGAAGSETGALIDLSDDNSSGPPNLGWSDEESEEGDQMPEPSQMMLGAGVPRFLLESRRRQLPEMGADESFMITGWNHLARNQRSDFGLLPEQVQRMASRFSRQTAAASALFAVTAITAVWSPSPQR
jgi:hypothetical protein